MAKDNEKPKDTQKTYGMIDQALAEQSFVAKADTRLWSYCCDRFTHFWFEHQPATRGKRRVPHDHRAENGKVGWFFPIKWLRDFKLLPVQDQRRPPEEPPRSAEYRAAAVERALGRLDFREQVCPKEIERWDLPAGTQITPSEVIYTDGTRESIDALRLRYGKFHAGAPRQSSEQQLLEDTLRTLHRKRDAA